MELNNILKVGNDGALVDLREHGVPYIPRSAPWDDVIAILAVKHWDKTQCSVLPKKHMTGFVFLNS
jgi:hypothetical protein